MIGPYFFESDVNSESYGLIIWSTFLFAIKEYDLENMWFQQDGASWSQLIIHNVVDTWNNGRWAAIFPTKFSSAMKHILLSVDMLINKIVVFVVLRILK